MSRTSAFAITVAAAAVLCFATPASAAPQRSASAQLTPKQVCAAVQSPLLAGAAAALAKLLPARFQPATSLKLVLGAVVAGCPTLAQWAVKVHDRLVGSSHPVAAVYAPFTSLLPGGAVDVASGAASVLVGWSGSGTLAGFQEQTAAGGGYDQPLVIGRTSPYVQRPVLPGNVYRFYVRGLDQSGKAATGWASSIRFTPRIFDTQLNAEGWTTQAAPNAYGGTLTYTTTPQTTAPITYTIDGFAMAIVAPTFPQGGSAAVYVDGVYQRTISLYSPTVEPARLVFSWAWTQPGRHYVRLEARSGEVDLDAALELSAA